MILVLLLAGLITAAPPNIGLRYVTNMTMEAGGRNSSGVLFASGDYTLFIQSTPRLKFPSQLNLGNHGQKESYLTYNAANRTCDGHDPLFCIDGENCKNGPCTALFDNPFEGLPYTQLDGLCEPSKANLWKVQNGGYVLTYCITATNTPLSLTISGAGGKQVYSFSDFKEQTVPPSTFAVPTFCICNQSDV